MPDVQSFHYLSPRGRPWLLFILKGQARYWFYWNFEDENKPCLPVGGRWVKKPFTWWGWHCFEGSEPEVPLAYFTPVELSDFPRHEELTGHFQLVVASK